jgi:hypothetical protein
MQLSALATSDWWSLASDFSDEMFTRQCATYVCRLGKVGPAVLHGLRDISAWAVLQLMGT